MRTAIAPFFAAALLAGSALAQQPGAPETPQPPAGTQQPPAADQQPQPPAGGAPAAGDQPGAAAGGQTATAALKDQQGQDVGTVELRQTPNGVLLTADLSNLPAGEHGFHVHETGQCEGDFTSAGGHYNPGDDEHGFLVEGGPHAGDMPNLHVPEGGSITIEIFNDRVSLEEGAEGALRDDDGSAIIIHANADDYESQPSGDAGDRIACGVIE